MGNSRDTDFCSWVVAAHSRGPEFSYVRTFIQFAENHPNSSCYSDGGNSIFGIFNDSFASFAPKKSEAMEVCPHDFAVVFRAAYAYHIWVIPRDRSADSPSARKIPRLLADGEISEIKSPVPYCLWQKLRGGLALFSTGLHIMACGLRPAHLFQRVH